MNFKRGQVWKNPDEALMMVVCVEFDGMGTREVIHYVTDEGSTGWFYDDDEAIINNINLYDVED